MSESQDNELLAYIKKINTSIEPYSKPIAAGVVILVVGLIGYMLYSSNLSGKRSDATLNLLKAVSSNNPAGLAKISTEYPGTPAAAWSQVFEGNQHLSIGLRTLFNDRDDAQTSLDDAQAAFKVALKDSDDELVLSRSHYGLARVAEALGNTDEAIDHYKQCADLNESDAMVKVVEARIDALGKPETQEFLAWFKDDFISPDPALPPSLPPITSLPSDPGESNLPDLGNDEPAKELKDGGIELPADTDPNAAADTDPNAAADTDPKPAADMVDPKAEPATDQKAEPATDAKAEPATEPKAEAGTVDPKAAPDGAATESVPAKESPAKKLIEESKAAVEKAAEAAGSVTEKAK